MHEMALARSIVEIVEEHAVRASAKSVRIIRLSIGALSHVEPRALEFGFEAVAHGTVAEGANLVIERPAGKAWCTDCSEEVGVASRAAPCPKCGGHKWVLTEGDDMRVVDLEVD